MHCPGCGGFLHYDSNNIFLVCASCGKKFPAKDYVTESSDYAGEHSSYNPADILQQSSSTDSVTEESELKEDYTEPMGYYLYTCGSCGAELMGTYETSAVGFCSYCGGQSIIKSRISGIKRPKFIVPFSKSKKTCCDEYMGIAKKLPFVPRVLKDKDYISEIRGIYIPYYIYNVNVNGHLKMKGFVAGDREDCTYDVDADVGGSENIPVDASLQMDDDIGYKIFPEDDEDVVDFEEGYMTGFYTEVSDMKSSLYKADMRSFAKDMLLSMWQKRASKSIEYECLDGYPKVDVRADDPSVMLVPAYFLTYRKKDRVCYTVLSGRLTLDYSESYASFPISFKSYVLAVLLCTFVFTFVFSLIHVIIPHIALMHIMILLGFVSLLGMCVSLREQARRIEHSGKPVFRKSVDKKPNASLKSATSRWHFGSSCRHGFFSLAMVRRVVVHASMFFVIFVTIILADLAKLVFNTSIFGVVCLCMSTGVFISGLKVINCHKKEMKKGPFTVMFIALCGASCFDVFAGSVYVPDSRFYIAMIIFLAGMVFSMFGMYKQYNLQCTKALPHFSRKGGYNSAKDM